MISPGGVGNPATDSTDKSSGRSDGNGRISLDALSILKDNMTDEQIGAVFRKIIEKNQSDA